MDDIVLWCCEQGYSDFQDRDIFDRYCDNSDKANFSVVSRAPGNAGQAKGDVEARLKI